MRPVFLRAVLLTAFSTSVLAQPVPDMVITATRLPAPVLDVPAGVTVIDRATIEAFGASDLVQALATTPGLRVAQSGGAGGNASVFIRGSNSNHVLVLRDGMPINDAADSSGAFNFGVDTLADVERIEVIRGPMAALYGSGAMGGVINLITRQGTQQGVHFSGSLAGGYPRQIAGNAVLSGITGPWDYMAAIESQSQRGFDTVPRRMSIFRDVPQGYRAQTGTLNLGYTPEDGTRLALLLRARTTTFGFNALGFPIFDDSNSTGRADSLLGRVGATTKLWNGSWESGIFVGHLRDDRRYRELLHPLDPNQQTNDSRYRSDRTDAQWTNTLHLSDHIDISGLSATDLTFGYQHIADTAHVRSMATFFGFPYAQAAQASMHTDAAYVGLQSTLWDRLTLTGQMRQDFVLGLTPFTWRTGAVLALPEVASRLKAAYGTAFRAPSLFDRYGVDSFGYTGNPNLRPESSHGWEAGFSTDLPLFGAAKGASIGITYFNNQVRNLIMVQFAPTYTSVNIGAAHTQGVETEISLRPARWLSATLAWTYTDARDASTGERLLRRPQHTLAARAVITPLPGLSIAPELSYIGATRDFLIDNAGFDAGIGTNRPGLIVNLNVSYDIAPNTAFFAAGRNLSNSRFEPVNGYQTPGASVLAGIRLRL